MVEINVEIKAFCAKPGPYCEGFDGLPSVHLRVMFHVKHSRLTKRGMRISLKMAIMFHVKHSLFFGGTISESRPYE